MINILINLIIYQIFFSIYKQIGKNFLEIVNFKVLGVVNEIITSTDKIRTNSVKKNSKPVKEKY